MASDLVGAGGDHHLVDMAIHHLGHAGMPWRSKPLGAPRHSRPSGARKAIAKQSAERVSAPLHGKCMHLPSDQRMADLLFSQRLLEQISLHAEDCKHSLQPQVFVLKGLHPADYGCVHVAVFCAPFVETRAPSRRFLRNSLAAA